MVAMEFIHESTIVWVRWFAGAVLSLLAVMAAVFWLGMNDVLLLGWAFAMIVAATLTLILRRPS